MTTALPALGLSERLRGETRQAHDKAEHSSFMEELLGGELDAAAFIALQEQALLFYTALEDAVEACAGDSRLADIADRQLDRRSALVADLTVLGGTVNAEPLPETAAYVAELQRIGRDGDVPALIAHHYTRYLGDLAGGQVIGRLMGRHYGVASEGLTFYDFPHIRSRRSTGTATVQPWTPCSSRRRSSSTSLTPPRTLSPSTRASSRGWSGPGGDSPLKIG